MRGGLRAAPLCGKRGIKMGQTKSQSASDFAVRNEEILKIEWDRLEYFTWGVRVLYWRKRAIFPGEFRLDRAYPQWLIHDMFKSIERHSHRG